MTGDLALFALGSTRAFGERVCAHLEVPLDRHEERDFEDGEHKARPLESVRGKDVYVLHSLHGDEAATPNDKLCKLLFFVGAIKDAGAAAVTAVTPYLCYARKDRKTKSRDPVTTRYVAALFEASGADRVVTIDVHNLAAYQNAFRRGAEHLEAKTLFVKYFAHTVGDSEVAVVSPDVGGIKRAEEFRRTLAEAIGREPSSGFMEKRRSAGVVSGETLYGDMRDRTVVIIDDLISTGTTMRRTAAAARELGARRVFAAATHGLFVEGADEVFADPAIDRVVVTDTVPPFRLDPDLVERKVTVLDAATMFAEAIRRLHRGGSLVELLER